MTGEGERGRKRVRREHSLQPVAMEWHWRFCAAPSKTGHVPFLHSPTAQSLRGYCDSELFAKVWKVQRERTYNGKLVLSFWNILPPSSPSISPWLLFVLCPWFPRCYQITSPLLLSLHQTVSCNTHAPTTFLCKTVLPSRLPG